MIKFLEAGDIAELTSIYDSEWGADPPGPHDAVIADVDDGELVSFVTSEAIIRLGMLWLTPRLRKSVQGAKRLFNLFKFIDESAPRGLSYIIIVDDPKFEGVAKRYGFRPVEGKVYRLDT